MNCWMKLKIILKKLGMDTFKSEFLTNNSELFRGGKLVEI